jgi:hypothetical protein
MSAFSTDGFRDPETRDVYLLNIAALTVLIFAGTLFRRVNGG